MPPSCHKFASFTRFASIPSACDQRSCNSSCYFRPCGTAFESMDGPPKRSLATFLFENGKKIFSHRGRAQNKVPKRRQCIVAGCTCIILKFRAYICVNSFHLLVRSSASIFVRREIAWFAQKFTNTANLNITKVIPTWSNVLNLLNIY